MAQTTVACLACTFVNGVDDRICQICEAVLAAPSQKVKWVCPVCTFADNLAEDRQCSICCNPKDECGVNPSIGAPLCASCGKVSANFPFNSCCRACALGQQCNCSTLSANAELDVLTTIEKEEARLVVEPGSHVTLCTPIVENPSETTVQNTPSERSEDLLEIEHHQQSQHSHLNLPSLNDRSESPGKVDENEEWVVLTEEEVKESP